MIPCRFDVYSFVNQVHLRYRHNEHSIWEQGNTLTVGNQIEEKKRGGDYAKSICNKKYYFGNRATVGNYPLRTTGKTAFTISRCFAETNCQWRGRQ